jgi:hypothetical protein
MQWYSAGPLAAVLLVLCQSPSHAAAPPKISSVKFTASGSTFNGTVTGLNFGTAPAGVPCNPCAVPEFSITNMPNIFSAVSFGITAWTNTSITLTGISAPATDGVTIALRNDALKNVATWGGNMPGKAKNPKIKKVTFSGSGATLKITVTGKGFGPAPSGVPGTIDTPYFNFLD